MLLICTSLYVNMIPLKADDMNCYSKHVIKKGLLKQFMNTDIECVRCRKGGTTVSQGSHMQTSKLFPMLYKL